VGLALKGYSCTGMPLSSVSLSVPCFLKFCASSLLTATDVVTVNLHVFPWHGIIMVFFSEIENRYFLSITERL
jgi:hypothetical protein